MLVKIHITSGVFIFGHVCFQKMGAIYFWDQKNASLTNCNSTRINRSVREYCV